MAISNEFGKVYRMHICTVSSAKWIIGAMNYVDSETDQNQQVRISSKGEEICRFCVEKKVLKKFKKKYNHDRKAESHINELRS